MNKRIVITAYGIASAPGNTPESAWETICRGEAKLSSVEKFSTERFDSHLAFMVQNLDGSVYIPRRQLRRYDSFSILGLFAGLQCVEAAQLPPEQRQKTGLIVSTALGPVETNHKLIKEIEVVGPRMASPALFSNTVINAIAGYLAKLASTTAYSSVLVGSSAVEAAMRAISLGYCERILAGAVEEVNEATYRIACELGLLATASNGGEVSQPFGVQRNGFILGEGSIMFMVETLDSALERNQPISAELASSATVSDHSINPHTHFRSVSPELIEVADRIALERAQLSHQDIDVIVAAAGSSKPEDDLEAQEIINVWGSSVPVVVPKAYFGEMMGADSEMGVFVGAKILQTQSLPPVHYQGLIAPVNLNREQVKSADVTTVLVHSSQHGGNTTTIILKKYVR